MWCKRKRGFPGGKGRCLFGVAPKPLCSPGLAVSDSHHRRSRHGTTTHFQEPRRPRNDQPHAPTPELLLISVLHACSTSSPKGLQSTRYLLPKEKSGPDSDLWFAGGRGQGGWAGVELCAEPTGREGKGPDEGPKPDAPRRGEQGIGRTQCSWPGSSDADHARPIRRVELTMTTGVVGSAMQSGDGPGRLVPMKNSSQRLVDWSSVQWVGTGMSPGQD